MKGDMLEAVKSMQNLTNLVEKVGPALGPFGGIQTSIFTGLKPELEKFRLELEKIPPAIRPVSSELQTVDDIAQTFNNTTDALIGSVFGLVRKAEAAPKPLNETGTAIAGVGTATTTAAPAVTVLGTSVEATTGKITTFVGGNIGLLDSLSQLGTAAGVTTKAVDPMGLGIAAVGNAALMLKHHLTL